MKNFSKPKRHEIKDAFTLAEVLITLAIVGIVAALTLPTLKASIDSKVFATNFKKTVAVLDQVGGLAKSQYNADFGTIRIGCYMADSTQLMQQAGFPDKYGYTSFCGLFNQTLKSPKQYTTMTKIYGMFGDNNSKVLKDWMRNHRGIKLPSGAIFAYYYAWLDDAGCYLNDDEEITKEWINAHSKCIGFIDANGEAGPNTEVRCSDGKETSTDINDLCVVKRGKDMGDIYPVVYHDTIVSPASNAAMYVFQHY